MKTNKIIREPIKYTYPHAEWSFHSISKNYLLHYECLSAVSIDTMRSILVLIKKSEPIHYKGTVDGVW